ncbi:flagellar protein FlaG [Leeia oryzae]|uniref:flagellar protein FlaG n=1 Tax=Leeia oryzae TaxID=356662 RepID=UPI000399BB12|nr:flagellar protein FlaG [Leeia oryzae]
MDIKNLTSVLPMNTVPPVKNNQPDKVNGATAAGVQGQTPQAVSQADNPKAGQQSKDAQQDAPNQQSMKEVAEQINKTIQKMAASLELSIDDDSGTVVFKVMDKDTKEVIRQIPSEDMMDLAKRIEEFQSLLTKQKA